MRKTITIQFKSSLRREFLDKLIGTDVPNLKEYDLWKFPFALEGPVEHDDNFDIPYFPNVVKEPDDKIEFFCKKCNMRFTVNKEKCKLAYSGEGLFDNGTYFYYQCPKCTQLCWHRND